MADKGWITVRNLSIADRFETANGGHSVLIKKISEKAEAGKTFTTYNFTVEDFHTYYVLPEGKTDGNLAVWVHNKGGSGLSREARLSRIAELKAANNSRLNQARIYEGRSGYRRSGSGNSNRVRNVKKENFSKH